MSPENERFLSELVAQGHFPSVDAAIDAAVGFGRRTYEKQAAEFKAKIAEGLKDLDEGRVAPLDMEKLKRELRDRWETGQRRAEAG